MSDLDVPTRWVHLVAEVEAASSLLRRAHEVWLDHDFSSGGAEVLMVLLSTGAEKLLKLTFGELHLTLQGSWPTPAMLGSRGSGYGHDLTRLDGDLRALLRAHASRAANPRAITASLDEMDADIYLSRLLGMLTTYATHGRFHNIDHLANHPRPPVSPGQLWTVLLREATQNAADARDIALGTDRGLQRIRETISAQLIQSMLIWQGTYARAWLEGVCGPDAARYGGALTPPPPVREQRRARWLEAIPRWPSL